MFLFPKIDHNHIDLSRPVIKEQFDVPVFPDWGPSMFSRSAANTIGFPKDCGDVICALAEMDSSQLESSQKVFQIYCLSHC